ncbi:MAG: hypothetical protein IPL20_17495 [Saprospiraceae bacterium]|nr:hypothetical protein [Saprospiraceae bacterium]
MSLIMQYKNAIRSQLENITKVAIQVRLLGRNPGNYGNIGEDAWIFPENINVSATTGGTGDNSLASGSETTAFGFYSTATDSEQLRWVLLQLPWGETRQAEIIQLPWDSQRR